MCDEGNCHIRGLGEAWHSMTGIAQGCPGPLSAMSAVAVYSVLTRISTKGLQMLEANVGTKDLRSLDIARRAMQEIIDDFGMTLNSGKTKVISHVEDVKSACEEAGYHMPYTQVAEHNVLGTIMGMGSDCNSAKKFWLEKCVAVCTRVVRIAHLPVAFRSKARLVEASKGSCLRVDYRFSPWGVWNCSTFVQPSEAPDH
eukprot:1339089-Amphidinium_carterae.1